MIRHRFMARDAYDVVIVGARCAGAATAILLARAGARVLVLDRQPYGSDTLSTHALMRPAVVQLARWGLLDTLVASGAPLITETTFHYADDEVTIPIRAEPGLPGLIAPRRTVLDRALVDAARAAGAEIVHDTAVQALTRDTSGRVNGVIARSGPDERSLVTAGLVIGADGIGSTVARQVAAHVLTRGTASAATIFGYTPAPAMKGYHWYFRPGLSAGVIPTHDGEACIFVSVPTSRFDTELRGDPARNHARLLAELAPTVARHIAGRAIGPLRGFRGVPGFVRQAHGPGWALVGDAGFFRDPLTSHGISDALRDAEGVANAVLAGTEEGFQRYQQERDALAYPVLEATDAIASFDWTLDGLKERHKRFSAAMKAEVEALSARADRVEKAPAIRGEAA